MDPVSAIASVIALYQLASTVSGLCFHYGQGARRADRDADLVINEIDILQRYLRTLKATLAKEDAATGGVDRLQNLNEIVNGESAPMRTCRKDLENIQTKLLKVQAEGRFKEAVHRLSWPFKQEEVSKTLSTLKRFTEAVDRALNMDNNEAIREIDNRTKHIQSSLESAESRQKREKESFQLSQEQQRANEMKEKVLDWLAHPDPSQIHAIVSRDRNDRAKTGRWFLDGVPFQAFKATPRSVLWLHGDSGCGKSVLCSAIIDEILAVPSGGSQNELIYWYFSATDKKRTSIQNLLRALITQLVLRCPVPPFLRDLWSSGQMGREAPKTADLVQTIQRLLVAEPSHTYFVIIDALDESDESERAEIMRLVRGLALLEVDIHIVVTSRTNTAGVEKQMRDLTGFCSIAVEGENADIDILAHITERLEHDGALAKWSPEVRQTIKDTLVENAGGMFRWVECQLQAVRRCRKPAEVRKTLNTLPKDLHEVYARDLAKVDESASQDVLKILEWLAFSQLKIRIEGVVDILAVNMESDPPAFDKENRMVDSEDILKMCGSLVRLDTNAEGQKRITAAHASVIDFLKTQDIKVGSEEVVRFSESQAKLRMAETCLIYLRYFSENAITFTEDNITSYPFAILCAIIWDDFYQELLVSSERVDMARLNELVMEMFSSQIATLNWVKLSNPDGTPRRVDFDIEQSQVKPAIYYAAYLGLPDIVKTLIKLENPIDEATGPRFGTPLVAACATGRTNVASLLLDSGADPNLSVYFYCGTPLAVAIQNGNFETVKLLLGREGVDINGIRHPPVKSAEKVLDSLVEFELREMTGEDENKHEYKNQKSRYVETGTELIELAKNAKTGDWGDEDFREYYGSDDVMGDDVQEQPDCFTQSSDTEDRGKNKLGISDDLVEIQYHKFRVHVTFATKRLMLSTESMVYIAAEFGKLKILEILLAAGADPNVRGGHFVTALRVACRRHNEDVVKVLLKNGAKTDVYGGLGGTPLITACIYSSITIVKDLIRSGADIHMTNMVGHSALLAAIISRYSLLEKIGYLISLGADPLQADKRGCNSLHYAAHVKDSQAIKRILEHGININGIDSNGWSPLHWATASTEDSIETVRLLLDYGCDKTMRDKQGRTALELAILFERIEEATILGDATHAYPFSFSEGERDRPQDGAFCDGCYILRVNCKPESWHHCVYCIDFDFCFRCILDKDIIHFKDHKFSNEPA